jgi:hypothetical protein
LRFFPATTTLVFVAFIVTCPFVSSQLTPAKFAIQSLWITPYGYTPGSLSVTTLFTDEQYWFGGTIQKSGQESADVVYTWGFDGLHAGDKSSQVQSGEVLVFSSPSLLAKMPTPTFDGLIILLWPGGTHNFTLTLQWRSASGYSGSISRVMGFNVKQNPTETQTSTATPTTIHTGIGPGVPSATSSIPSNPPVDYAPALTLIAGIAIGAFAILAITRRPKSKRRA